MFKRKYIYIALAILALSLIIVYNYMYKDHRNIATEEAEFKTVTTTLQKEYSNDVEKATAKYIDKTIEISGKVTEVELENNNFTLDDAVLCYTDSIRIKEIKKNTNIVVKGRSIGYDELLELIKLDQVFIVNP